MNANKYIFCRSLLPCWKKFENVHILTWRMKNLSKIFWGQIRNKEHVPRTTQTCDTCTIHVVDCVNKYLVQLSQRKWKSEECTRVVDRGKCILSMSQLFNFVRIKERCDELDCVQTLLTILTWWHGVVNVMAGTHVDTDWHMCRAQPGQQTRDK